MNGPAWAPGFPARARPRTRPEGERPARTARPSARRNRWSAGTTWRCSTSTASSTSAPTRCPVPPEAVAAASRAGLRPAFVTNNASRTPATVAAAPHRARDPGRGVGRRDLRPGRRHAGVRTRRGRCAGPRGRRRGAPGGAHRAWAATDRDGRGRGRRRAGLRPGRVVDAAGRGRVRRHGRPAVAREQPGRDDPDTARHRAGQRCAGPGHRRGDRAPAGRGGGQAGDPAARRGGAAHRRAPTRSSSGTGWTPTSRARTTPACPACSC